MIRLTRENDYVDKIRAYKIYVDEVYLGDIGNNETREFVVDSGKHSIYAKIDWCRSNKLEFDSTGSVVELEVGSALGRGKFLIPFIGLIYITLLKNDYLWIKEKEN